VLDDERRLPLHEREVAPAEGRVRLRWLQQFAGLRLDVSLVLLVVDGEDQVRERLQPAVPHGIGHDLQEFRVPHAAVDTLEIPPFHGQNGLVEGQQSRSQGIALSHR
jgi:hypothetical protein